MIKPVQTRRYVALLRAISNVSMQPFREGMEDLGFTDVVSFGMSGNLLFNSSSGDLLLLEKLVSNRFGTAAVIRKRTELARIVAHDPYKSGILFLTNTPTSAQRREFDKLDFGDPRPALRGRTIFFVYPVIIRDKRTPFDFESALGILGTMRSAGVVKKILEKMGGSASKAG